MIDWASALSGFVAGTILMLATLGLGTAVIMPDIDRWTKRFFIAIFSVLVLLVGFYFVEALTYARPEFATLEQVVYFIESQLMSFPITMFTVYLLHSCGERIRDSTLFRAVIVCWLLFFAMVMISLFTPFIYSVTPENTFYREPDYPLVVLPLAAIMVLNIVGLVRRREKLSKKYYRAFLIYLLPLAAAVIIHIFVSAFLLICAGYVISAFSMYAIILTNQIEQYLRQQREIARQRASIMVLQMRPHFIYNTMTSIYYLCEQDPAMAKQVTLDFTTYLRKNFTAIVSDDTIPFSEELEHTKAYLAVEQAQFEDMLFVEYDIAHTQFRVPPLTLQPIAENAVKHGLDPDSEPLHLLIRTKRTGSGSRIIVEDNGRGFESYDNNEPHTALANIQQRLEMMCNGSLTIAPREGGGTVVEVNIPKA